MGILTHIRSYSVIGLDTPIFIYHLESNPSYSHYTKDILLAIEDGQIEAVTSIITLLEINVRPYQLGRRDIASKYEALLVNFPHLTIMDVNRDVVRRAAQLRAEYRLRPADALQVATCLLNGAQVFLTNDRRLSCLSPVITILILDNL
jgi:predicted nucleic acid-binding protein